MTINMPQWGRNSKHNICPSGVLGFYAPLGHPGAMVPNNITRLRKAKGWSQTDLADKIGTTLNMMGKLERGARELTTSWIDKLAEALEVEPFILIAPEGFGEEPSEQQPEPIRVDPETIEPLLDALLPLAPPGQMTDQSLRALSAALAYGLELLGDSLASPASPGALKVAARGAVSRFREIGSA